MSLAGLVILAASMGLGFGFGWGFRFGVHVAQSAKDGVGEADEYKVGGTTDE